MIIDSHLSWCVSLLSGIIFSQIKWVTVSRILIYLFLIGIYFFPALFTFSETGSAIFSVVVSLVLFFVKLFLYILNRVIDIADDKLCDSSQNSTKETATNKDTEANTPPDGIPPELWEKRLTIDTGQPITENTFNDLITEGFDPNVVVRFIQLITPVADPEEDSSVFTANFKKTRNVLCIFGKEIAVPFNRLMINSLFPENYSLLYCFLVLISTFIMNFIGSLMMSYLPLDECLWLPFIFGPALYSTLHPPEVDPYSTTRGDIFTGITRPVTLIFISSVILYLSDNPSIPNFLIEIRLPFNPQTVYDGLLLFFKLGLFLFPLWILLFIGHPIATLNWILEFVSRYFFGHAGATSIGNSIAQFIKSSLVYLGIYFILSWRINGLSVGLCAGFATIILQYPLSPSILFKKKGLRTVGIFLGMGVCAFLSAYTGFTFSYQNSDSVYILCICAIFIIDVLWPYLSSVSSYLIFYMRLINTFSKTFTVLKLLTPALLNPLMVSVVLVRSTVSPQLSAFIIVCTCNRAFTEPHLLLFAMVIAYVTFIYEFKFSNWSISLIYSLTITRKLVSIYTTVDFYLRARQSTIIQFLQKVELEPNMLLLRNTFVAIGSLLMPFLDRFFNITSFLWSLITGAPFDVIQSAPFILTPLAPRPNSFWNQVLVEANIDIARAYQVHRTEHPIETPVYTSMMKSLTASLSSLIKSGRLGIVTSNEVYLFLSEPLAAFVHIIALEPNCVRFQLRGLEYNDETVCHLGEIAMLQEDVRSYRDHIPNFRAAALYKATDWKTRATGIKLQQYSITRTKADVAFVGYNKEEMHKWIAVVICNMIKRHNLIDIEEEEDVNDFLMRAATEFNLDDVAQKIQKVYIVICSEIFGENETLNLLKLFDGFREEGRKGKIIRKITVVLSLASMGLAPSLEEDFNEILNFVHEVDRTYFAAPVSSIEFDTEFQAEKHDLVAYEDTVDGPSILFFRLTEVTWDVLSVQKDFVRSYWASEVFSQIFFGEDNSERNSIQEDDHMMRNLIVQACDLPIGYPALVSPVVGSYSPPPNFERF